MSMDQLVLIEPTRRYHFACRRADGSDPGCFARSLTSGSVKVMSVFFFDEAAANMVNSKTTIFRHRIGSCRTFDPVHPKEGIACDEAGSLRRYIKQIYALARSGGEIGARFGST
jgi:hypothetical protein